MATATEILNPITSIQPEQTASTEQPSMGMPVVDPNNIGIVKPMTLTEEVRSNLETITFPEADLEDLDRTIKCFMENDDLEAIQIIRAAKENRANMPYVRFENVVNPYPIIVPQNPHKPLNQIGAQNARYTYGHLQVIEQTNIPISKPAQIGNTNDRGMTEYIVQASNSETSTVLNLYDVQAKTTPELNPEPAPQISEQPLSFSSLEDAIKR